MIYYQHKAIIALQDGTQYKGYHFGATISTSGEIVFNTAMTGYTESITDPSYKGQLLVYTFPLIGNYGIPEEDIFMEAFYESESIHINGLIVSDYSHDPNHWRMAYNLSYWLKINNIPGISGIDTRALTKKLRKKGSMLGKIIFYQDIPFYNYNKENLASQVCIKKKTVYGNGKYRILLVDFGVKNNILLSLIKRDCTVVRVPWDYDFRLSHYDGLFLSNGPGNPKIYQKPINYLRYVLNKEAPIFGICLGNQLLGLAAGGNTYKLTFGHRSHNQPVKIEGSVHAFITSQNHGYVIEEKSLPRGWKVLFRNLNDNSCEGLIHEYKPFFSVQFHPEGAGGPLDTEFLLDWFIQRIHKYKKY
ncbi:carbamoyl phosphate synthase small subunit [Candidatus Uzinura diaspidicola str. ASNER]|uniref:Carbamoyl phosphate synthase small chain n=1 Tax=Candidatus Uzinura diaspidicola str. ASNER TaxID=1133592 RepID=L7VJU0_9FLAO|nr:carbamoyl phosphate synthase small subunit [Candidatus Uzinura diaspidicola str. ASNER]